MDIKVNYKINYDLCKNDKCKYYEDLFIICMKRPIIYPQKDKCKYFFDVWYKCIKN